MATPAVYKNVKVYSGGHDLSGDVNTLGLEYAFDEVEATCFGSECHWALPGLPKLSFSLEGLASSDGADGSDDILSERHGTVGVPMLWCPQSGADGEAAYFAETLELTYAPGGALGEMYKFAASGVGRGTKLVRGTVMATGAKTSTGNGTARELGAVASGQKLYGILQVLAVSGTNPTLDLVVESDDAEGFASGVTRLTFTQATAVGAQFITPVAGPITDDWWRAAWTIGGTDDPSFTIALCVGIL